MTRMMELINGWLARYYAVVHSRMAVRLASVRAAVHGDGEENIAFVRAVVPGIRRAVRRLTGICAGPIGVAGAAGGG